MIFSRVILHLLLPEGHSALDTSWSLPSHILCRPNTPGAAAEGAEACPRGLGFVIVSAQAREDGVLPGSWYGGNSDGSEHGAGGRGAWG